MLKQEQIDLIKKDLAILYRQKAKYALHIEEARTQIEELTAQVEQYPKDTELQTELQRMIVLLENLSKHYELTTNKINGAEWLLET